MMAFHTPQTMETDKEPELTTAESALHAAQTKAHVAMALSALDSRYKENLAAYAEELHACIHRIETARIELEHLKEKRKPYREALLAAEKEIDHEMRMLERLSEQYVQKSLIIIELKKELASAGDTETQSSLPYRENELASLNTEIENLELLLLDHELERQNHLLSLEPVEQQIRAKEKHLRQLEAEKHYIESSHLHRITKVSTDQQPKLLSKDDEI
jgi:chromosome segregation ATPase